MTDPIKVKKGKRSRAQGAAFELRVRADLEEKGWIVDKWTNNVEFEEITNDQIIEARQKDFTTKNKDYRYIDPLSIGKLIKAKAKWAGPGRPMMMGAGFCDFICFRRKTGEEILEMMKNE
ncbi:MAG: hypothetical protein ACTSWD_04865 [Candidatus Heimdallarchaeota archaeon]